MFLNGRIGAHLDFMNLLGSINWTRPTLSVTYASQQLFNMLAIST